MPAPGLVLPVALEPVPGVGVDMLGCVADGAGVGLGVVPPEPEAGALPVPGLLPLLCASAGATIAATIASVARILMVRDAIAVFLLGANRSVWILGLLGRTRRIALMNAFWMSLMIAWTVLVWGLSSRPEMSISVATSLRGTFFITVATPVMTFS
jgi:hypothetical protein